MKRLLVSVPLVICLIGASAIPANAERKTKRVERHVSGTYLAPSAEFTFTCSQQNGQGCVAFRPQEGERFLSHVRVFDLHGYPVRARVSINSRDHPNIYEVVAEFCGVLRDPVAITGPSIHVVIPNRPLNASNCLLGEATAGTVKAIFSHRI